MLKKLRELELIGYFGDEFIELARSVYKLNDERFSLKDRLTGILALLFER